MKIYRTTPPCSGGVVRGPVDETPPGCRGSEGGGAGSRKGHPHEGPPEGRENEDALGWERG